jgi:GR25 family glycosyltransferase involved in LPS biosynthesis
MKAYVINLDSRPDRWSSVLRQWESQNIELIRMGAIDATQVTDQEAKYLSKPVVANWLSQCQVYREFLGSEDDFALILEDDFLIDHADFAKYLKLTKKCNFDFLQLGYLLNSRRDFLDVKFSNLCDLLLKVLNKFSTRISMDSNFFRKKLITEQTGIDFKIVLRDARAGSHAYIISRKFATAMLELNSPVFIATDGLFMAIASLRYLRMGRLRKNVIRQSDSPSSILL